LRITPLGKRHLDTWLRSPVAHVRQVRGELLLKLALLARMHKPAKRLPDAAAAVA
jgi:hypothetical protein